MMYGVYSYLRRSDDLVLMVRKPEKESDPNSGLCTLPGGKIEKGEKGLNPRGRLERAILETRQETGLILLNPQLRGIVLFDNEGRIFDNWKSSKDYMVYTFVANEYAGDLLKEGGGGETPFWVPEPEIPNLPKNAGDVKIYEWIKTGRFFMGVIRHKGKELDEENTFENYF